MPTVRVLGSALIGPERIVGSVSGRTRAAADS